MRRYVPALLVGILTTSTFTAALAADPARPVDQPDATRRAARTDPWSSDPGVTARLGSDDANATAITVSRTRFEDDTAAHVVLTRDDAFPDALAGTPLVGDGPMLVTDKDQLDAAVRTELDRVLPDGGRVYVLGGVNAMSQSIEDQLDAAGYDVKRLSGASRIDTAIAIAEEVTQLYPEGSGQVLIARARGTADNPSAGFADSVTGGAYAASAKVAVVLSETGGLNDQTRDYINGREEAVLLGGQAALAAEVESAVRTQVATTRRVFGAGRDATAVEIARQLWGREAGFGRYTVINGFAADAYLFGLPAAGLASDFDAPLLVVSNDVVPGATAEALTTNDCALGTLVLGGAGTVAESVRTAVESQDGDRACIGDGSLTIGALFPRSIAPQIADNLDDGLAMALADLDDGGDLAGLTITVRPGDHNPDVTSSEIRRLASAGVDVFVGPAFSRAAHDGLDDLASVQVPACSPTATLGSLSTAEPDEPGWFTRAAPSDALQAAAMLKFAADAGHTNITVLVAEGADTYLDDLQARAATYGLTIVHAADSSAGWDSAAADATGSDADAHLVVAYGGDAAEALRAIGDAGIDMTDVIGNEGFFDTSLDGAAAEGLSGVSFNAAGFGEWSDRFAEFSGREEFLAAYGYDCTVIAVLAAATASSTAPVDIAASIVEVTRGGTTCTDPAQCLALALAGEDINYEAVTGTGDWNDAGEPTSANYYTYAWTGGEPVQDGLIGAP